MKAQALVLVSIFCAPLLGQEELQRTFAPENGNALGWSVSAAGDVDNDGVPDTIAGGWVTRDGKEAGTALVISGATGLVIYPLVGESPQGRFGWAVAGAGDVNDDGFADVIVGMPLAGIIMVHEAGRIKVFSGADGTVLHDMRGAAVGDHFGWSVDGVGDLDGDGHDDFIVGSPHAASDRGMVQVFSGDTGDELYLFRGLLGDRAGFAVASAGLVDNDLVPDVVIGEKWNDGAATNAGRIRIFSGADGSLILKAKGTMADDRFGAAVAAAGDVNNDGRGDVIVGVPRTDDFGEDSGSAQVISGMDGATIYTWYGDAAGDQFGLSVSGAGDLNDDGRPDLIVGAPFHDGGGSNAGMARLFSGATGNELYTFLGNSPDDRFGRSVSDAGDLNLDGFADVVVGAPYDRTANGVLLKDDGQVYAYGGNDLYLSANRTKISVGQSLKLMTAEGPPGNPTLLFVASIEGVPCWCPVGGIAFFNVDGLRSLRAAIPPEAAGLEFELGAIALDVADMIIDSETVLIEVK